MRNKRVLLLLLAIALMAAFMVGCQVEEEPDMEEVPEVPRDPALEEEQTPGEDPAMPESELDDTEETEL